MSMFFWKNVVTFLRVSKKFGITICEDCKRGSRKIYVKNGVVKLERVRERCRKLITEQTVTWLEIDNYSFVICDWDLYSIIGQVIYGKETFTLLDPNLFGADIYWTSGVEQTEWSGDYDKYISGQSGHSYARSCVKLHIKGIGKARTKINLIRSIPHGPTRARESNKISLKSARCKEKTKKWKY